MISALIFRNRLRAARFAYLVGEFAGWHGLVPDSIRCDLRRMQSAHDWNDRPTSLLTSAIRNGILDGCMMREMGERDRNWRY